MNSAIEREKRNIDIIVFYFQLRNFIYWLVNFKSRKTQVSRDKTGR